MDCRADRTDKTGMLTQNALTVTTVRPMGGFDEARVLALAALASSDGGEDPVDGAIRSALQPSGQALLLRILVTPAFNGAAVSVVNFRASSVSSLACAIIVSNFLRACAVDSTTSSDAFLTPISSWAYSKAVLVLVRANSMILRL
jgi:magnesium-transporting ATPase (P-type)